MRIDDYEVRVAQALAIRLDCSVEEFVELCIRTASDIVLDGPRRLEAADRMKEVIVLIREAKKEVRGEAKKTKPPLAPVSSEKKSARKLTAGQKRSTKSLTHSPFADALKKTKT